MIRFLNWVQCTVRINLPAMYFLEILTVCLLECFYLLLESNLKSCVYLQSWIYQPHFISTSTSVTIITKSFSSSPIFFLIVLFVASVLSVISRNCYTVCMCEMQYFSVKRTVLHDAPYVVCVMATLTTSKWYLLLLNMKLKERQYGLGSQGEDSGFTLAALGNNTPGGWFEHRHWSLRPFNVPLGRWTFPHRFNSAMKTHWDIMRIHGWIR